MPELPEVETVVRSLWKLLVGRRIERVEVLHKPSIQGSPQRPLCLAGKIFKTVSRRGKFIRINFDNDYAAAVHLRMTGWLGVVAADKRDPKHAPYERLRLYLDGGKDCLVFRDIRTFGRFWCGSSTQIESLAALQKLGPEPLEIDPQTFCRRMRERRGRVKSLLLNQEFLAGVGNIYADESLFAAGLHPLSSTQKIKADRACALLECIQKILSDAIAAGGSSIDDFYHPDGQPGWFQRNHQVYGREGEPCRKCGSAIKRIVLGQRGTWFCPKCQKPR